jgi:hypothetical protein
VFQFDDMKERNREHAFDWGVGLVTWSEPEQQAGACRHGLFWVADFIVGTVREIEGEWLEWSPIQ